MEAAPENALASQLQKGRPSGRMVQVPRYILAPVPLPALQPVLRRIVQNVAARHPGLFRRIEAHTDKTFCIDPVNMPFAMLLRPDPEQPDLRAIRRHYIDAGMVDARISGTFLTLLDMIDGRLDGDALFFSRDLCISGNTQAVVCLRNALDDLETSLAEEVATLFGPPGRAALNRLRSIREAV